MSSDWGEERADFPQISAMAQISNPAFNIEEATPGGFRGARRRDGLRTQHGTIRRAFGSVPYILHFTALHLGERPSPAPGLRPREVRPREQPGIRQGDDRSLWGRWQLLKSIGPEGSQKPPIEDIRRLQGSKVIEPRILPLDRQRYLGQANPPQDFTKPQSGDTTVEVDEWVFRSGDGVPPAMSGSRVRPQKPCWLRRSRVSAPKPARCASRRGAPAMPA